MSQVFFFNYFDSPSLSFGTGNLSNLQACISCELPPRYSQETPQGELFLSTTPERHFSEKGELPVKTKPVLHGRGKHTQSYKYILQILGGYLHLFKKTQNQTIQLAKIYDFNVWVCIYNINSRFFQYILAIFIFFQPRGPSTTYFNTSQSIQFACLYQYSRRQNSP